MVIEGCKEIKDQQVPALKALKVRLDQVHKGRKALKGTEGQAEAPRGTKDHKAQQVIEDHKDYKVHKESKGRRVEQVAMDLRGFKGQQVIEDCKEIKDPKAQPALGLKVLKAFQDQMVAVVVEREVYRSLTLQQI
jgi:hypothetical protein